MEQTSFEHLHLSWSGRSPQPCFCWVCCVQPPVGGTFPVLCSTAATLLAQENLQIRQKHFWFYWEKEISYQILKWDMFPFYLANIHADMWRLMWRHTHQDVSKFWTTHSPGVLLEEEETWKKQKSSFSNSNIESF